MKKIDRGDLSAREEQLVYFTADALFNSLLTPNTLRRIRIEDKVERAKLAREETLAAVIRLIDQRLPGLNPRLEETDPQTDPTLEDLVLPPDVGEGQP